MNKWTLIEDWKKALKKYWSFRLSILSALLSAAEVAVQLWAPLAAPGGMFAVAAVVVSLAAGLARIVAQPKANDV